ncbi:hypothetical protein PIROE2DRAFT_15137 [Piromyces sp. E2]|nr:hypothetical protein PIROE2DRAFT_15137 [Piromyces sp. E2]|eukprot:OUM59361.1 hypothetical protein PIROE2DRAFT_15137 [Piromyces sp. E2]
MLVSITPAQPAVMLITLLAMYYNDLVINVNIVFKLELDATLKNLIFSGDSIDNIHYISDRCKME